MGPGPSPRGPGCGYSPSWPSPCVEPNKLTSATALSMDTPSCRRSASTTSGHLVQGFPHGLFNPVALGLIKIPSPLGLAVLWRGGSCAPMIWRALLAPGRVTLGGTTPSWQPHRPTVLQRANKPSRKTIFCYSYNQNDSLTLQEEGLNRPSSWEHLGRRRGGRRRSDVK